MKNDSPSGLRQQIRQTYIKQASVCLASAILLWIALDAWIVSRPHNFGNINLDVTMVATAVQLFLSYKLFNLECKIRDLCRKMLKLQTGKGA